MLLGLSLLSGLMGWQPAIGPLVIVGLALTACGFLAHPSLKSVAFTAWVFVFVAVSMFYPGTFGTWFGVDLKVLIVPLIQIIMFGMGTTLSLHDFGRVLTMPWPVFVGMVLQFSVMPTVGWTSHVAFGFEPEVAAGIILIGSVPGGVASNVMTYLARGDVALSVTMTACSTLMSPVMTPLLMKMLAGRFVPIDVWEMLLSILNMIAVPIVAGLIANRILYSPSAFLRKAGALVTLAIGAGLLSALFIVVTPNELPDVFPSAFVRVMAPLWGGFVIGFAMLSAVSAAKWVVQVLFAGPENWMDRALPVVSMMGICFIIAIITSRSRQQLLTVGPLLILAAMLHNTAGYVLGYWGARLLRLGETAARTVAIEVGLQNGGMASGLAIEVLKSANAALAPAVFGPWMNISGSVLATLWHRRPVGDQQQ